MTAAAVALRADPALLRPPAGRLRLGVISLLLVVSLVSWRQGTFYSGAIDPVVAAKGVLGIAALIAAVTALRPGHQWRPTGVRTLWFLATYLTVSTIGGWATGAAKASAVITVRVLLVAVVVWVLLEIFDIEAVLGMLLATMAAVGLVGAVTGFSTYLAKGRLAGGIPALSSNEIALLVGAPTVALVWKIVEGRGRIRDGLLIALFLGVTWLTGSRTGLIMLAIAVLVVVLQAARIPVTAFITMVAAAPVLVYAVLSTGLVSGYLDRGGTQNISTLNSRAIAWRAALRLPNDFWERWFGGGLALKQIPVYGQLWNQQILDSSWVSAFVQAGVLGLALLIVWAVVVFVASVRTPRPLRILWTGMLVYLVGRSILESGLMDATPPFVLFLLISIMSERRSREAATAPAGDIPVR